MIPDSLQPLAVYTLFLANKVQILGCRGGFPAWNLDVSAQRSTKAHAARVSVRRMSEITWLE